MYVIVFASISYYGYLGGGEVRTCDISSLLSVVVTYLVVGVVYLLTQIVL